ncbi:MAG: putative metal-dependent phosphoesterase TrpH [Flavobacteriales bacterium]|jgi:predicted metal-dependent phosphoesterase TrpH
MLVDLHAYSSASGGAHVNDLVDQARDLGLDAICIVDRSASADAARGVVNGDFGDFPVFVGVEVPTRQGDLIVFTPEVDPFLTREEWRQLLVLEKPDPQAVVALAEAEGGVVLLAHPYDRSRLGTPGDRMFVMDGLAGVEVGSSSSDARSNRTATEAVSHSTLPGFAGSARSSHDVEESRWFTLFSEPVTTQAELVVALKGGNFWPVEVQPERSRGRGREKQSRDGGSRRRGGRR